MAPATENKSDRLPDLAADSVRRQVAVIIELSRGTPTALGAKAAIYAIQNGFDASKSAMLREMPESFRSLSFRFASSEIRGGKLQTRRITAR